MPYTVAEQEAIGLCIALEGLNEIVNRAILDLRHVEAFPGEAEVRFETRQHQQLFLIRLLDFVKERGAASLTGVDGSCLAVLRAAGQSKAFEREGSAQLLIGATNALDGWLAEQTQISLWLPSLGIQANLNVPRVDFLHIAGNQVKHNLSRLTGVSREIVRMLAAHGHQVPEESVPLALDDFREHLEEHYFNYYGTWLAELLNEVRWGLHEYLLPTFAWSYTKDAADDIRYTYQYPASVTAGIPRQWFWRLMNHVRRRPYLPRFVGAHYMKRANLD